MGLHCVEKPIMRMKVKNEKNELCQGTKADTWGIKCLSKNKMHHYVVKWLDRHW